ncbi:hypothetical protein STANM309S_01384 [Streptomyces tanashiensis]
MTEDPQGDPYGTLLPGPVHGGPQQRPGHPFTPGGPGDGEALDLTDVGGGGERGRRRHPDEADDRPAAHRHQVVPGQMARVEEGLARLRDGLHRVKRRPGGPVELRERGVVVLHCGTYQRLRHDHDGHCVTHRPGRAGW